MSTKIHWTCQCAHMRTKISYLLIDQLGGENGGGPQFEEYGCRVA